ncbi:hypothetical protein [Streptomyces sp. NPDC020681]|uniref:hypothetical protein n=1 Tax=Streptomyces sp. NPDC020681 TaxID=3365083 RepID=UPI0037929C12
MTGSGCCRALRAAVFAAACVLLATAGHAFMSGATVPWWVVTAAFAPTAAAAWLLAHRERGLLMVTSAAVAAQAAMHSGFSFAQAAVDPAVSDGASFMRQWVGYLLCGATGSASPSDAGPAVAVVPPGHLHHMDSGDMGGMAGSGAMTGSGGMAGDMDGMSPSGMLAAHLLSALLCGLWLAYGEQAAYRIGRALAGWFAAPLRLILRLPRPLDRPRVRVRPDRRARTLRQLLLVHAIVSRGPPAGIAVV